MTKNLSFKNVLLVFSLFLTVLCSAQVIPFAYTHGFGTPATLPPGMQLVSYDGATNCSSTPNGANAVTTMVLRALPGYEFNIKNFSGTGARNADGSSSFNFTVVNNGTVSSPVTEVPASTNCSGNTPLPTFTIPLQNQLVTSGNTITLMVQRAPGSTQGTGYSHVKSFVVTGDVRVTTPVATPATDVITSGFTAHWEPVTNATGYRVDVSTSPNFSTMLPGYNNVLVNGLSLVVTYNLTPGVVYYYRVKAVINFLGSAYSNTIEVQLPCEGVALPTASSQTFCGNATVSQLEAQVTGTAKWYASETATEALEGTVALTSDTYYVSQQIGACESLKVPVVVTVNELPVAPVVENNTLDVCANTTLADVAINGDNLLWYTVAMEGDVVPEETIVAAGETVYYVSQTVNGCESLRTVVTLTGISVAKPEGEADQTFTEVATTADIEVSGEGIVWYADEALTQVVTEEMVLLDATTYYAMATNANCVSEALAVTVHYDLNTHAFTKTQITVYPNPADALVTVTGTSIIEHLTLFNLLGQEVISAAPNALTAQVDMSALQPGAYLVKVKTLHGSGVIKLLKK
jgi:hypothetical protein